MTHVYRKVSSLLGLFFAFSLMAPGVAQADDACGTPAKDAVYKAVVVPGTDEVTDTVTVVVTPATLEVPPGYEDVKVIDEAYLPATPGTPPVEEVSHMEERLVTPGVPEALEVSHQEFKYQKTVVDLKTEYWFAKYTQTREGTTIDGEIVWGDFGPWTKRLPETHTSWEDSTDTIRPPQHHGAGKNGNVHWERVWQAQYTGISREVKNGSRTEYYKDGAWTTDTPGPPWILIDERNFVDEEYVPPVPPEYEDVKVVDMEAQPGTPGTPAIEEVSHMEKVLVTPGRPGTPAVTREVAAVVQEATPSSTRQVLVSTATEATQPCVVLVEELAQTGMESRTIFGLGALLVLAGAGFVGLGRRLSPNE